MMKKKGDRDNLSSKKRDSFFITKKTPTNPSTASSSHNFVEQKIPHENIGYREPKGMNIRGKQNLSQTRLHNKNPVKSDQKHERKPFDKRKWRLQTYSKKYKLEQWEEKRKTAILKDYRNQMKCETTALNVQKIYEQYDEDDDEDKQQQHSSASSSKKRNINKKTESGSIDGSNIKSKKESATISKDTKNESRPKKMPFKKAHMEFARKKNEKNAKKQEAARSKGEREAALKQYKEKKINKFKKLNQKTKKGQPIMKARLEMLLEQIQASISSEN